MIVQYVPLGPEHDPERAYPVADTGGPSTTTVPRGDASPASAIDADYIEVTRQASGTNHYSRAGAPDARRGAAFRIREHDDRRENPHIIRGRGGTVGPALSKCATYCSSAAGVSPRVL